MRAHATMTSVNHTDARTRKRLHKMSSRMLNHTDARARQQANLIWLKKDGSKQANLQ